MNLAHLTGKKVRLTRWDFELDTEALARWSQDSEYIRLANSDPARIWTAWQTKEWFEKRTDLDYCFAIHTVAEDKLIGNLDFDGIHPVVHNAWVGIGIGERDTGHRVMAPKPWRC
jgi:RimJ/RimL family protein N-acetyltransferase